MILISGQLVTAPLLLGELGTGDSLLVKEVDRDEEGVVVTAVRSGPHGRSDMSIISMLNIAITAL